MRNLILLVLLATMVGCATYDNKPRIMVTHVLAVTETGDTLRLPINMIRPNVYYKIIRYPNNYYNNWNQYPFYHNQYQGSQNNNRPIYTPNNSNNTPVNTPVKPISKPATSDQNKAVRKRGGN